MDLGAGSVNAICPAQEGCCQPGPGPEARAFRGAFQAATATGQRTLEALADRGEHERRRGL